MSGTRHLRRDERGDTLIEVLIAVVIIGLTVSGFLGALVDSISSSAKHRSHVIVDTVLKSFAEAAKYDIQFRPLDPAATPPAPLFKDCATSYTVLGTPSPTRGPQGTAMTLFGTGYGRDRPLQVTMAMAGGPSVVLDAGTSDKRGDVAVTVPAPSGPGPYTITVTDGAHQATSSNTYTVTPGPAVLGPSSLAGYQLDMTIAWWNDNMHRFDSSTDSCPAADHSGIQKVALTVTAPDGTAGALDFIVDNPGGLAPSITSPDHTTFYEGRPGRFTVTATGYPNPNFTETGPLPPDVQPGAYVTLSRAGLLSGTPAIGTAGSYPIAITASSSAGTTTSAQPFTLTVLKPPSVTTANLPDATQGQVGYHQQLTSSGGAGTMTWTPSFPDRLPAGFTLSETGLISWNVAANATTLDFQVTATDANGERGVKDLTITVNPPPTVTSGPLPDATQDQMGYAWPLSATGGTGALSWRVSSGALPSGLTLSNTGTISGNVAANASTQTFTANATDANGVGGAKVLALTVNPPPAVATRNLADATPGQGYAQQLASTGGTGTISWAISSGSLPAGLTMSGTGTISGNVAAPATTQTFTVRATDANAVAGSKAFTIVVTPVVATRSLPDGRVNVGYSATLAVNGGTGPFRWTKTAGTLPAGLSLGSDGVISGSPTSSGTFGGLVFRVTDANNRAASSGPLSIIVIAPTIAGVALQDGGGTPGQIEPGDRIVVTFWQPMKVNSLCSTWTGDTTNQSLGAADSVVVALNDGNQANDTITVSAGGCTLNFGVLDLGAGSYASGGSATFGGAGNGSAASTVTWDAATFVLTVTLGTKAGPGTAGIVASSAPVLNISSAITDPAGAAIGNSPFSVPSGKQF